MYFVLEETEKPKTVVPFIYKGYRLYPIRKTDKEKYNQYLKQVNKDNPPDCIDDGHMTYLTTKYNNKENKAFFVFKDNQIVGQVFITDLTYQGRACITSISLLKEHQNKGLGKGLMMVVETLALAARCSLIELFVESDNHSVLDFYKKLGFTIRLQSQDGWSMVKDLSVGYVKGK